MTLGNGWPVIDVRKHGKTLVIYLRIPAEIATEVEGGCACFYCKTHPKEVAKWDALAVCAGKNEHSWTVHFPETSSAKWETDGLTYPRMRT